MDVMDKKRVALIDDDPLFVEFISSILSQEGNFRVASATTSDELFALLESQNFQCVLVDYDLGTMSGLMVGQQIKDRLQSPPPIVMLTGEGSERTVTKAFRVGFSDYVSKRHLDKDELIGAVRSSIKKFEADQMAWAREQRVREHRRFDELTGLLGVAHTNERIEDLSGPKGGPFALLTVSLTELAELRQVLGYKTADKALQAFALKLSEFQSKHVICGHMDHDSLAVIISANPSEELVENLAEKIRQALTFVADFDRSTVSVSPTITRVFKNGSNAEVQIPAKSENADTLEHATAGITPETATDVVGEKTNAIVKEGKERRAHTRHRVLKRGKIIINDLVSVVDCTVRDMSEGGARLRVNGVFVAPDNFVLDIVGSGIKRPVSTQWQCGTEIGVQYMGPNI